MVLRRMQIPLERVNLSSLTVPLVGYLPVDIGLSAFLRLLRMASFASGKTR